MNQTQNLIELCGLFSDDASLLGEVVQAYEQPAAYLKGSPTIWPNARFANLATIWPGSR